MDKPKLDPATAVHFIAIYDTLSRLMDAEEQAKLKEKGLEQFLPGWYKDGEIQPGMFFAAVGGAVQYNFLHIGATKAYLQLIANEEGVTHADLTAVIAREHPQAGEPGVQALNIFLTREMQTVTGSEFPYPNRYLLASARVARDVGIEVFEGIYGERPLDRYDGDEDLAAFEKIRLGWHLKCAHAFLDDLPKWEKRIGFQEDGSLDPEYKSLLRFKGKVDYLPERELHKIVQLHRAHNRV